MTIDNLTSYTTREYAFQQGLAYVDDNGTVIMKGDDTTQLTAGVYRDRRVYSHIRLLLYFGTEHILACSVRISSKKVYNTGLFILDLNRVPWGCGTSWVPAMMLKVQQHL